MKKIRCEEEDDEDEEDEKEGDEEKEKIPRDVDDSNQNITTNESLFCFHP